MAFRDKARDGTTRLTGGALTLLQVYPIGSLHFTVNATNPAAYFGGTWVAWGSGRVPVGVSLSDAEFDTVEETGGSKTHTLTEPELPPHAHSMTHTHSINHGHTGFKVAGTAIRWLANQFATGTAKNGFQPGSGSDPVIDDHTGNSGASSAALTGGAGSGDAHNNLQPYITCYIWKRTA